MTMNAKRLHIHSLPLVLFALAGTGAVALYTAGASSSPVVAGLLRPAIRVQVTGAVSATVVPNTPAPPEEPGIVNGMQPDSAGLTSAANAGDGLVLQIGLDQAVSQVKR